MGGLSKDPDPSGGDSVDLAAKFYTKGAEKCSVGLGSKMGE